MNPTVRLAELPDIPKLQAIDPWPREKTWRQIVANAEVIVLEVDGQVIGLARYSVLWTTVPFLGLIEIEAPHRKKGYSRRLLEFLKGHLREQGFVALLSSSQTDQPEPQAWHRHMGFKSNGIIENVMDDNVGELVYLLML